MADAAIVALNAGSSSLKFGIYTATDPPRPIARGEIEHDRAGDEVAQLYVRDVLASVARPVMELKKFRRIHLAPGERQELAFELGAADLRMLDRDQRWIVEPGVFRVMVGGSSKDIRLRGQLTVR